MNQRLVALFLALAVFSAGCDSQKETSDEPFVYEPDTTGTGGDGGNGGNDTQNNGGVSGMEATGGAGGTAGSMNTGGTTPITEQCSPFELDGSRLQLTDNGGYQLLGIRNLSDGVSYDVLFVELHTERGLEWTTGTYDLANVGADYDTCQICVVGIKGANPQRQSDEYMMASSGTVELVEVGTEDGSNFMIRFGSDVEMEQITFQSSGGRTVANPVIGGEKWCTQDMEISAKIPRSAPPAFLNEQIEDFSLLNCGSGEMESFGQLSDSTNSIWIMGTAGWCPACKDLLQNGDLRFRGVESPLVVAGNTDPEKMRLMLILGENPLRQTPSLTYCRRYSRQYAVELGLDEDFVASTFYIDNDGVGSFPTLFAYINPYTDEDGSFGLPWNAFVQGRAARTYLYGDRATYRNALGTTVSLPDERLGQLVAQYTAEDEPTSGGSAGNAGSGGAAGDAGTAGEAGDSGSGGTAGDDTTSGTGGMAGTAGAGGTE